MPKLVYSCGDSISLSQSWGSLPIAPANVRLSISPPLVVTEITCFPSPQKTKSQGNCKGTARDYLGTLARSLVTENAARSSTETVKVVLVAHIPWTS
jgi:hypothetical protein